MATVSEEKQPNYAPASTNHDVEDPSWAEGRSSKVSARKFLKTAGESDPNFFTREFNRVKDLVTDCNAICSIIYCIAIMIVCVATYFAVIGTAQQEYFLWVQRVIEESKQAVPRDNFLRLPDRILDLLFAPDSEWNRTMWFGQVVDLVPSILIFLAPAVMIYFKYLDILTHFAFLNAFLLLNNAAVETLTVMPSAYGQDRCIKFINRTQGLDIQKGDYGNPAITTGWQFSPMGTCTSMMWSGHTTNSILGLHGLLTVLERRFPGFKGIHLFGNGGPGGISLKTIILFIVGLFVAAGLLANTGHYTSDIWIGYMLIFLVLSNDKFKYWCLKMNPFLKKSTVTYPPRYDRFQAGMDYEELLKKLEVNYPHILMEIENTTELQGTEIKGEIPTFGMEFDTQDEQPKRAPGSVRSADPRKNSKNAELPKKGGLEDLSSLSSVIRKRTSSHP